MRKTITKLNVGLQALEPRFMMSARLIRLQNVSKLVVRAVFKHGYSLKSGRCLHMGEYFTLGRLSEIDLGLKEVFRDFDISWLSKISVRTER